MNIEQRVIEPITARSRGGMTLDAGTRVRPGVPRGLVLRRADVRSAQAGAGAAPSARRRGRAVHADPPCSGRPGLRVHRRGPRRAAVRAAAATSARPRSLPGRAVPHVPRPALPPSPRLVLLLQPAGLYTA